MKYFQKTFQSVIHRVVCKSLFKGKLILTHTMFHFHICSQCCRLVVILSIKHQAFPFENNYIEVLCVACVFLIYFYIFNVHTFPHKKMCEANISFFPLSLPLILLL